MSAGIISQVDPLNPAPIFASSYLDARFLCRQAAGSRTCHTIHQQYGDIILVEFRIYQGFKICHRSSRALRESITQTIFGMLPLNRVGQAI
jgi:hypothetical protein